MSQISPGLFQVLSGRAADPGPIEPRTPREASLIEAVRKEARKERSAMYRELKEAQVKQVHQLEQAERLAVLSSAQLLDDKLSSLNFPLNASTPVKPCATFRDAITQCYKANGKDNPLACAGQVEAFSECAKQLTRIGR